VQEIVLHHGACVDKRHVAGQALAKRRAVAPWALITIDALALALVPPQARHEAQLVRAPASLDAGHDTSPAKRDTSGFVVR